MKTRNNTLGFTAVEGILIVVILALIGLVSYKVYSTRNSTDKIANDTTAGSQVATNQSSLPTVSSTSDLDKAQTALVQNDTSSKDNSDLTQLDNQLSGF